MGNGYHVFGLAVISPFFFYEKVLLDIAVIKNDVFYLALINWIH